MLSKKHILTNIVFLLLAISSYSAEITAIKDGGWDEPTTWSSGTVPANTDEVIIPAGITVDYTDVFLQANYFKLYVAGTFNITEDFNLNEWAEPNDVVTVHSGGIVNIGGNLAINTDRTDLKVKDGGKIKIGGNIIGSVTDNIDFKNYGKIEVTGYIGNLTQLFIYNYFSGELIVGEHIEGGSATDIYNYGYIETGKDINIDGEFHNKLGATVFVHGSIIGKASLQVFNYGNITIDSNFEVAITDLYNYATGKIVVFGDMNIGDGSGVINNGWIQVKDLSLDNQANSDHGFDNTHGTLIVLDTIRSDTKCPLCGYSGELFFGNSSTGDSKCGTGDDATDCDDYLGSVGSTVQKGKKLWLNAGFISDGSKDDGEKIKQWGDLANNFAFKMREKNEANQPTLRNNAIDNINYNPVMDFSEANVHLDLDSNYIFSDATESGLSYIAVSVPETNSSTNQFIFDFGTYNTDGYGLLHNSSNIKSYTPTAHGGIENTFTNTYANEPVIIGQVIDWKNTQKLYVNGKLVDSKEINSLLSLTGENIDSLDTPSATGGPFTIGGKSTNPAANDFNGKLAELIIYAHLPHDTVINAAESFLAIKYGISLAKNYTDYYNNTIYSVDGTYDNGIAGVAREDLNMLHQKISSARGNEENLTVFVGDKLHPYDQQKLSAIVNSNSSYLLWGHDNRDKNSDRIYKTQITNFNQSVTLAFKIPNLAEPIPQLAISGNDSFVTKSPPITGKYKNDTLFFEHTFTNNSIEYFKLDFSCNPAPREPGVGINTTEIDSSAELHIKKDPAKPRGVLLPSLTDAEMTTLGAKTPEKGTIIFNTTQNRYMFYNGSDWSNIGGFKVEANNAAMGAATGDYKGEIRYNSETNTLFIWNGTKWNEIQDAP